MGIKIENLTKQFEERIVIQSLSYEFPESGIIRIAGDSGAGKTTLLRIIAGLEKLYTGRVIGADSVSYAFQEYRLFPWLSALDNVTVAAFDNANEIDSDRAREILMRLGFESNELKLFPSQLSGGMRQRVSLARAFATKREVILLDEPTKELDHLLSKTVYKIIEEYSKNHLILLVTHDIIPEWLKIDDTIYIDKR